MRILLVSGSTRAASGSTALLFCTPEYAGTLPGSLKNLLDWTVGGGEMDGKPAGWINVAVGGRGRGATEHLAMVLRYVGAVAVEGACAELPVPRESVGPDGLIGDPAIRARLTSVLSALARSPASGPKQCRATLRIKCTGRTRLNTDTRSAAYP
jgi:chromate reductase, NAD(P)H dehydrogenase (quinone)